MRQYSICPFATCFVKVAHELVHRNAFRVYRKVRYSLEFTCLKYKLLLVLARCKLFFEDGVFIFWHQLAFEHASLDAQSPCLRPLELAHLAMKFLEVEGVENILQHANASRLTRRWLT